MPNRKLSEELKHICGNCKHWTPLAERDDCGRCEYRHEALPLGIDCKIGVRCKRFNKKVESE